MIIVAMPDGQELRFEQAVFDYNGTLAVDGIIKKDVKARLAELGKWVHVFVVTADTFGLAKSQLADIPEIELVILTTDQGGAEKADFVKKLGDNVIVVGNGVNDRLMFQAAAKAICVIGEEGASGRTLVCADIIVTKPEDALDLLLNSKRMVATLRV